MENFKHITDYLEQAFTDQPVWREHALIKKLQQDRVEPIASLSLYNMLELFKAHFLVRHAVYQLRAKWRAKELSELTIGAIEIASMPYPTSRTRDTETGSSIREIDLLEHYYNDLSNYFNMTEAEVDLLLNGFWQRLQNPQDSAEAFETLGLEKGAGYQEIKSAFRRHAQKSHPDKGGDELRFQSITKARDTLLAQVSKN